MNEQFYRDTVNNAHQCFQLLTIDQTIDSAEFQRRLRVEEIDYRQFMTDYAEWLDLQPENDKLYIQRVIDLVYTA